MPLLTDRINVGTAPDDQTGDSFRLASLKVNGNADLYDVAIDQLQGLVSDLQNASSQQEAEFNQKLDETGDGSNLLLTLADGSKPRLADAVSGVVGSVSEITADADAGLNTFAKVADRLSETDAVIGGKLAQNGDASATRVRPKDTNDLVPLPDALADRLRLAGGIVTGNLDVAPGLGFGVVRHRPQAFASAFGGDATQHESSIVVGSSSVAAGSPVWSAYRSNVQISAGTNAFIWPILGIVDYNANTPGTGQHVGVTGKAIRRKYAPGGHSANPELWGLLGSIESVTGQSSDVEGGGPVQELDYSADGADPGKIRQGSVIAAVRRGLAPGPAGFGSGQVVTSGDAQGGYGPGNVYWAVGYLAAGAFKEAAYDTRQATMMAGAAALWLATGHPIAWNTDGSFRTAFNTASGRIETTFNSGVAFSIDSIGTTRAAAAVISDVGSGADNTARGFRQRLDGSERLALFYANTGLARLEVNGSLALTSDGAGNVSANGSVSAAGPLRCGVYTVATLPTPGVPGRIAYASDLRVFAVSSGSISMQAAGGGTGGHVTDTGAAWRLPGYVNTASA